MNHFGMHQLKLGCKFRRNSGPELRSVTDSGQKTRSGPESRFSSSGVFWWIFITSFSRIGQFARPPPTAKRSVPRPLWEAFTFAFWASRLTKQPISGKLTLSQLQDEEKTTGISPKFRETEPSGSDSAVWQTGTKSGICNLVQMISVLPRPLVNGCSRLLQWPGRAQMAIMVPKSAEEVRRMCTISMVWWRRWELGTQTAESSENCREWLMRALSRVCNRWMVLVWWLVVD